jgi:sugar phosphate isomerase/epimerase
MKNISIGVASFSPWMRLGKLSLEEFAMVCREHGFNAIEPCDRSIKSRETEYLSELKRFFNKEGFIIPCIDVRNDFTVKDMAEWKSNVDHVQNWIRVANLMESPVIRIWTGVKSVDDLAPFRLIRALSLLVPMAEKYSIKLAVENHGGVSSNPILLTNIIESFDSPFLGLCPDFGHLADDDRYQGLERMVAYSFHIHAKTHGFDDAGEEKEISYERMISIINRSKYSGYISIEYEGAVEEIKDNINGIKKTERLIRKYLE